jgi:hypothetical protein
MSVAVAIRYEDDSANPIATRTAVAIEATDVDFVDETDNSEIRYYLSAEHAAYDNARSEVFAGDFSWPNWVAPTSGSWTFYLRKVSDDSSVADSGAVTFDAPS